MKNIQWTYFAILYKQFTPWIIRTVFITGNGTISILKSNQIREPIQGTPEPIEKTHS
jgi:hypothetical protein